MENIVSIRRTSNKFTASEKNLLGRLAKQQLSVDRNDGSTDAGDEWVTFGYHGSPYLTIEKGQDQTATVLRDGEAPLRVSSLSEYLTGCLPAGSVPEQGDADVLPFNVALWP